MNHLSWVGLQAFAFSLVLTPIFRDVFRSYKVVDEPDNFRKVHIQPIPRVGGIAIVVAYFLTLYVAPPGSGSELGAELSLVRNLLPAALLVFITGLIDDFFGLKPSQKMVGQVLAAGLAWWAGVRVAFVSSHALPDVWGFVLTVGWLLVCTNAFNLVDGLDGLAAGVGLFATMTIFTAALLEGNQPLMFATLPLAGCLLGFLCFNFNPATVFLGDCGSLLIGFLLGCFGAIWTNKTVTFLGLTAPLMALSLPLIDVLLCIVRRWLRNQPIFSADRGHIHHRLLDRGLSPRQAVLILYGLCGISAAFSLLQSILHDVYAAGLTIVGFTIFVWMGIHYLRYAEFMLAGQMLRTGEFQRSVNGRISLASFEKAIAGAKTMDECWEIIVNVHETFGFSAVRLHVAGRVYERWAMHVRPPRYWTMYLPISTHGEYIELGREFGSPVLPMVVVPFVELLTAAVSNKLKDQTSSAVVVSPESARDAVTG
jgi:UDP-GlcNAc:undecaprenyl-phosphate/decaprenyl-phosphate GlcNAc-1-phosphate transferase